MEQEFKDRVYQFITDSTADRAVMHEKLTNIEEHTKKTNGAIAKAQKEIASMKQTIHEEDTKLFWRIMRYMGIALLAGSFLWIKESREIVFKILGIVL